MGVIDAGDGSDYGSGDGSGYGYGYGDGNGSGYGDGSGYGLLEYCKAIAGVLDEPGLVFALWKSDKDGRPCNGGATSGINGLPRYEGYIDSLPGPLEICTKNALHGTIDPSGYKGERLWLVALYEPVATQGNKIASLKRKILKELPLLC